MSAALDGLDIARRVVDELMGSGDVAMALVAGSVARGLADAVSDVDVYLYCDDLDRSQLDQAERLAALGGVRLFGIPTENGWFEKYRIDRRLVDVERVPTAALDAVFAALHRAERLEPGVEKVLVGLRDAVPIVGGEMLASLQRRLFYSDDLARAQAQAHLSGLLAPVGIWRLTFERGDRLSFAARISATMLHGVALLGAVNRTFVVTSEPKWLPWQIERFEHCPNDMMDRVDDALARPTAESMADLHCVLEEIVTLVERAVPGATTAGARFALSLQP